MKLLQTLSIRSKLILIALVPLLALLYFLIINVSQEIEDKNQMQKVYDDVVISESISDLIIQIQQERGFSVSYLTTHGQERSELFHQRIQTDQALNTFDAVMKKYGRVFSSRRLFDQLPAFRDKISVFNTTTDSIIRFSSELVMPLIEEVHKATFDSDDADVKSMLMAHQTLLYGKEYFGELRSKMKQAILTGSFTGSGSSEFLVLKGKYESKLESFEKNATPELKDLYHKKMSNPSVQMLHTMIDSAYYHPNFTKFPFSYDTWWTNAEAFLNTLTEIENASMQSIRETSELKLSALTASMTRNIVVAVLSMIVIVLLLVYTIRSIVAAITRLKDAADRIASGEVDLSVDVRSKDEIGSLANSFNELIRVSKTYAVSAQNIGRGDYTKDVLVRNEKDLLGASLNTMQENLRKLSEDNERRTWLLTGSAELYDKIRGERDVRELAQEIISKLATYLNAQIGAIYITENNHLLLAGSYAFHHRKNNPTVVEFGQGLIGQAALEKKPIVFSDIPDDYIYINSGLGHTIPKNIIVHPFLYDGQVNGVIEIGTTRVFSELDLELLRLVSDSIGIAINSSISRTKLKELLEETQRQAEELEAQQEEMRQINEELQEKTQLLERSEAELKAQQEELQQTNEELEEKANLLEEQKEKLEMAKLEVEGKARELEVTSKYKSEFLANMSHELRTPLNSILILTQLLAENKGGTLGDKEVEFAKNIHSSGADLLNLINEILDLSKVESGKIDLDISDVNLSEVQNNMLSTFKELARTRAIEFEFTLHEEQFAHPLVSDKQRLEQILRNLLSNAFKFTGKSGKVSVDIGMAPAKVRYRNPRLRRIDQIVAFSVSDNGIGIPESKQSLVFEAFQQADGSTKRKYGGTGLGLSISRELAHALGGEIHLDSEEGKGSTFTLYLPLVYSASVAATEEREAAPVIKKERPVPPPVVSGASPLSDDRYALKENEKVILIIEDDLTFASLLLDFFRERGYRGIVAHQGNIGLSLARYYRPDAIILDMQLPVMDGSEVLRQLKNDPNLRHIPVQVISAHDRRKEGLDLGAFDYIRKPLQKEDLQASFDRIEEMISKKLKKLLVVEDNQPQNKAIRELIGNGDVKSFPAYTGEEALALMKRDKFDCVIIDLGLPDMSGLELLEKIKADSQLNRIPIIVYTGKELNKEEAARLNKLANTVVLKTADSTDRLLDEAILFLHKVESALPKEKQQIIRKLHRTDEVLKDKKVLIVDDDMRNIYSLTNALEEEGLRCFTAENGKASLQTLREQPDIDIVLMDVMMPEMDGYEATLEIRKIPRFSKLPIIALTAKAMKGDREKCLEAGMSDYVAKPVNIEQLLSLMRVWLYR